MPTIADIVINGHTYTDAMWRADPEGTLSGIGNDIATLMGVLNATTGILTKAISGNVTLTTPESTNIGFVFTGSLTADATITFAAGFSGIAQIENQTTGGFNLICGLAAGDQVTVPPSGSAAAFCDGTNFSLQSGIVRTSAGAKVIGNFEATGTGDFGGDVSINGALSISGGLSGITNLEINGALTGVTNIDASGNVTVGGSLNVDTNATVSGALTVVGDSIFNGSLNVGDLSAGVGAFGQSLSGVGSLVILTTGTDWASIVVRADEAAIAGYYWDTGALNRWAFQKTVDPETGSNAGSDLELWRYNDLGAALARVLRITRNNGYILLNNLPTSSSGLSAGTLWNNSGVVNIV